MMQNLVAKRFATMTRRNSNKIPTKFWRNSNEIPTKFQQNSNEISMKFQRNKIAKIQLYKESLHMVKYHGRTTLQRKINKVEK